MNPMVFEKTHTMLDKDDLRLQETLFHVSNGYLGVRANLEEGAPQGMKSMRGSYINGVYEFIDMKQAEPLYGLIEEKQTMVNAFDTQGIALTVAGEAFHMDQGTLIAHTRRLDMERGVSERVVLWQSPGGRTVEINSVRMASLVRPEIFLIVYRVKALDFAGDIAIESTHFSEVANYADPDDPRLGQDGDKYLRAQSMTVCGARSQSVARAPRSGVAVCVAADHQIDKKHTLTTERAAASASQKFSLYLQKGESVTLNKYTAASDSLRGDDCIGRASCALNDAMRAGAAALLEEQRVALAGLWALCGLHIGGDEALERAMRFNLYQLMQTVSRDAFGSIAAKGLSGEGYEGHYFWDTEMFLSPFYALTMPELCKNLIAFRARQLPQALENARIVGHKAGALYPWRTIMGRECSGYFPSGTAAYHIGGDIAYGLMQYWYLTGDDDILVNGGAEMLYEIARLWMDVGVFARDGRFHINCVTGPDEYTCMVNNNYYTNVLAAFTLKSAVEIKRYLADHGIAARRTPTDAECISFLHAAARVIKPYDPETGINPQDDSFLSRAKWDFEGVGQDKHPLLMHYHPLTLYRHQVCKQADTVMAHFLLEDEQDEQTMRASFEYYEKITTHDSSLSKCVFSIMASRLGLPEKAYAYFGDSAMMDIDNSHMNTGDGLHMANMGGSYLSIVCGFAGLRVKRDGVHLRPRLPEKWTEYRFSFRTRGAGVAFFMNRAGWKLTLIQGERATMWVDGKLYTLDRENPAISNVGGNV